MRTRVLQVEPRRMRWLVRELVLRLNGHSASFARRSHLLSDPPDNRADLTADRAIVI